LGLAISQNLTHNGFDVFLDYQGSANGDFELVILENIRARAHFLVVLTPYRDAKFEPHTGPFLFEFQRYGMSSEEFCSGLDTFLSQLNKDFRYAVEIRNASLLAADYRTVLENHEVVHVYNHWSYMPPLAEQHQRMERFTALFTVLRLVTPLKMTYEAAKKRAEPYTKIVEELPDMRRDTVDLVKKAVGEQRQAYVLVNNRSEGMPP
jgi:uncharacterized protein YecE (DUF72 family)